MLMETRIFDRRKKVMEVVKNNRKKTALTEKIDVPDHYFIMCPQCKNMVLQSQIQLQANTCPSCKHHLYLPAKERLDFLFDKNYNCLQNPPTYANPIDFPDYPEKLDESRTSSELEEALTWGEARLSKHRLVYFLMDSAFMMGSMSSYVGEQITRAFEYAKEHRLSVLGISASGGARMQEGMFSLIQMAKTVAAVKQFQESGLLYVSLITNPTFGGVSASFALLGDINIGEPSALIGFAGPRVIKETIGGTLPEGFQSAEYLLEHGFLDLILSRDQQKSTLETILKLHEVKR